MRWTALIFVVVLITLSVADDSTDKVEARSKRVSSKIDFDTEAVEEKSEPNKQQSEAKSPQAAPSSKGRLAADASTFYPTPVVLPPVNVSGASYVIVATSRCLLYMEGINVVVRRDTDNPPVFRNAIVNNGTFGWTDTYVTCSLNEEGIGSAVFHVEFKIGSRAEAVVDKQIEFIIEPDQIIGMDLTFTADDSHYWRLSTLNLTSGFTISPGPSSSFIPSALNVPSGASVDVVKDTYMDVESFHGYGYACSSTSAAFIKLSDIDYVGIAFYNFEVDLRAYIDDKATMMKFNRNVYDCVGTFSVGSWMGIVCSLVMATILMFGYLMLQSVQTMERFDDPKQKPIVINFKE